MDILMPLPLASVPHPLKRGKSPFQLASEILKADQERRESFLKDQKVSDMDFNQLVRFMDELQTDYLQKTALGPDSSELKTAYWKYDVVRRYFQRQCGVPSDCED